MQKTDHLKKGPKSQAISKIDFSTPEIHELSSGITLYSLKTEDIGAIKFELVFEAGRLYEHKKMIAQTCSALISEGCEGWSSEKFSEAFDFEGSYLSTYSSSDFITIRLTCASKSFSTLLPLFEIMVKQPTFSKEEMDIFISRKKQKMAINLTKNDVIGYRALTEGLYGADGAYGYNSMPDMLDDITSQDLHYHYQNSCVKNRAYLFISGDFSDDHIKLVDEMSNHINSLQTREISYQKPSTQKLSLNIKGRENQSSLKLGLPLFSRNHPDYSKIYFLNNILGGYFGSRLMKNIREDKGYTYNIYSMLDTYKYDGAWIISCELDEQYVSKTLSEIEKEFHLLKTQKVGEAELAMVKNYLLGNFMSSINGPLKAINTSKNQVLMGLNSTFYKDLFDEIQTFSAEDVQHTAQEYLNMSDFSKVIVGKG